MKMRCWTLLMMLSGHMLGTGDAHPQCLDFRPPFETTKKMFCSQYQSFGCCDLTQDAALKQKFYDIVDRFDNMASIDQTECQIYLHEILCQECSPYAAHIFDAEDDLIEIPFPGLCTDYCTDFYDKCKALIPEISNDASVAELAKTRDGFCRNLTLSDPDYCYPDWIEKNTLQQDITRESRTELGCLCLEPFAASQTFQNALALESPPDDSGRIFVTEQKGVVHVFSRNQTKLGIFMDLSQIVLSSSRNGDERGFFNLIFHPNFVSNRKVYAFFSIKNDTDRTEHVRISEFLVKEFDENEVDPDSERVIIQVQQPYGNHNGGELLFGFDGYLYVFLGDGGAGGDPRNNGQNKGTLLGSAMRLDIDNYNSTHPYSIPPDNPFVNESGSRPEIYAYGIRNIWRCDLDEGDPVTGYGRGRIICGDVGQGLYEEIDIIVKGGNYGWNSREGFECYKQELCGKIGEEELPIFAYNHTVGKSVTGGHIYRGCMSPNLNGLYIYGDFFNGKLFGLVEEEETSGKSTWKNRPITMCGDDVCFNGLVNKWERNILSFGEDENGEIYILTTDFASTTHSGTRIYKIVDPRRRGDPADCHAYRPPPTNNDRPSPPVILSVSPTDDNKAVTLRWRTGDGDDVPVLYYYLQYRIIPHGEQLGYEEGWVYMNYTLEGNLRSHTTQYLHLSDSTSYQFRLSASNTRGVGYMSEPSQVLTITTEDDSKQDESIGVPQNVVAKAYSDTAVSVEWDAPFRNQGNAALLGYYVRYNEAGHPNSSSLYKKTNDASVTTETLTGLKPITQYEITVAAFNAAGIGIFSEIIYVVTPGGRPTLPPYDVSSEAINATSVRVHWITPQQITTNIGFKIILQQVNSSHERYQISTAIKAREVGVPEYMYLTHLKPYTLYEMWVLSYNSKGDGPASSLVQQVTLQHTPSEVSSFQVVNIQADSVNFTWTPPLQANGLIIGYTLGYGLESSPGIISSKELHPDMLYYTLTGLQPATRYTVTLQASTIMGRGPARTVHARTTTQDKPPPAVTMEICNLNEPISRRILECAENFIISNITALYGRMNIGRCTNDNFAYFGCSSNVSATLSLWCKGRKRCRLDDWFITNRIIIPDRNVTCPTDAPKYLEITYQCVTSPCNAYPCYNNGSCSTAEDPYGIGYYCYCPRASGGRHCQIVEPCRSHPCPPPSIKCIRIMDDDLHGRVCYDRNWRIIDT